MTCRHLISCQKPDISAWVEIPKNNNSCNGETAVDDYVDEDDYSDTEKKSKRKQKPPQKNELFLLKCGI